jgi:hypothetical protein
VAVTCSKRLQFLSQPDELVVNERILTASVCKSGTPPPYTLHQDARNEEKSSKFIHVANQN